MSIPKAEQLTCFAVDRHNGPEDRGFRHSSDQASDSRLHLQNHHTSHQAARLPILSGDNMTHNEKEGCLTGIFQQMAGVEEPCFPQRTSPKSSSVHLKRIKTFEAVFVHNLGVFSWLQPPEAYEGRAAQFPTDVWGLGGTLVEFFTYRSLWFIPPGQSALLKVPEFIVRQVQPHAVKSLSDRVAPVLEPTLRYNKEERPSALELNEAFQTCLAGQSEHDCLLFGHRCENTRAACGVSVQTSQFLNVHFARQRLRPSRIFWLTSFNNCSEFGSIANQAFSISHIPFKENLLPRFCQIL